MVTFGREEGGLKKGERKWGKSDVCNTLLPCAPFHRLQQRCHGDPAATKDMRKTPCGVARQQENKTLSPE